MRNHYNFTIIFGENFVLAKNFQQHGTRCNKSIRRVGLKKNRGICIIFALGTVNLSLRITRKFY